VRSRDRLFWEEQRQDTISAKFALDKFTTSRARLRLAQPRDRAPAVPVPGESSTSWLGWLPLGPRRAGRSGLNYLRARDFPIAVYSPVPYPGHQHAGSRCEASMSSGCRPAPLHPRGGYRSVPASTRALS
jgi:hypothetical protein